MKNAFLGTVLASACVLLGGCAGGSSAMGTGTPPVYAQQGYSNASLNGTYSVSFFWDQATGAIGTVQFDGQGNISGGSINKANGSYLCQFTLKGTYSVQNTGTGSATLDGTTTSSPCASYPSFSTPLTIVIGQQGATVNFLTNSGDQAPVFGWASKQ